MKISLVFIGKTDDSYIKEGIQKYVKRLTHYTHFEIIEIKDVKSSDQNELMKKEAELVLQKINNHDVVILLDENGKSYNSVDFAGFIENHLIKATKSLVFVIGGAFGHHAILRERADGLLSLSKMTFSHQMVRIFIIEQIYRAFTIIKNEKYHNP